MQNTNFFQKILIRKRKNKSSIFDLNKPGLTMIELLIVMAILAALMISLLLLLPNQLSKGRDGKRKGDLETIKVAFEHYYSDNDCYPEEDVLEVCNGDALQPYLEKVPCDPSGLPYLYIPAEGNSCTGYAVYAAFEAEEDPIVEARGCDGPEGCNVGVGFERFNYFVSSGITGVSDGSYTGDNGGGPDSGEFACSPGISGESPGECNSHQDPVAAGCPVTFSQPGCQNSCATEAYWCDY